ncbi:hypothetical protein D3C75_1071440 [compost metagenome]
MQALDQQTGRPLTQHGHQADTIFGLPDELHRLVLQLLIETMAVQRVLAHARAHQGHQRQPFTQLQFTR